MEKTLKYVMSLLVAVAACVGVLAAGSVAFGEDYGRSAILSGNTVAFTWDKIPQDTVAVKVKVDTLYVSGVTLIADKIYGPYEHTYADGAFSVSTTLTDKAIREGATVTATAIFLRADGTEIATDEASQVVPATGVSDNTTTSPISSRSGLATTGAAVAPYAVAVLLLCAAGVVLLVVRNKSKKNSNLR